MPPGAARHRRIAVAMEVELARCHREPGRSCSAKALASRALAICVQGTTTFDSPGPPHCMTTMAAPKRSHAFNGRQHVRIAKGRGQALRLQRKFGMNRRLPSSRAPGRVRSRPARLPAPADQPASSDQQSCMRAFHGSSRDACRAARCRVAILGLNSRFNLRRKASAKASKSVAWMTKAAGPPMTLAE